MLQDALPWGGEFTSESLQFFSPALLWSRLPLDQDVANGPVFDAFCEYLEVCRSLTRVLSTQGCTQPPALSATLRGGGTSRAWGR